MYITNAFSINMVKGNNTVSMEEIGSEEVQKMELVSAIGHDDTAAVVSNILGKDLKESRITLTLAPGTEIIVAQLRGERLPKGSTKLPDNCELKFYKVGIGTKPMAVTFESHVDHGMDGKLLNFILKKYKDKKDFFIEVMPHPEGFAPLESGLHGPDCGDSEVPESEVTYSKRGDRSWVSRMVDRPKRKAKFIKVIGGRDSVGQMVLYTVYGMMSDKENTPREPGDSFFNNPGTEAEKEKSVQYWSKHALSK